MVVKYKGQKLRYVKDFHGKEVLWILSPEQIEMPGMIFVGGYPNEYCIFMDTLSDDEQKEIRKQLNSSWIKFCQDNSEHMRSHFITKK